METKNSADPDLSDQSSPELEAFAIVLVVAVTGVLSYGILGGSGLILIAILGCTFYLGRKLDRLISLLKEMNTSDSA